MPPFVRIIFGALLVWIPTSAHAQWQVVQLHAAGTGESRAFSSSGGAQGGFSQLGPGGHGKPFLWFGSPSNFRDLTPTGFNGGQVSGLDAGRQVGYALAAGNPPSTRAALWTGTAESFVNLHPNGYLNSYATAVAGNTQVGFASEPSQANDHAMLWRGSASSAVDLHPAGAIASQGLATDGVYQGGYAIRPVGPPLGTVIHAALWQGTSSSYVNMNPPGARESWITGMAPGVQAGWAILDGFFNRHAVLWSGNPGSYTDLNPAGSPGSFLLGTNGQRHVGQVLNFGAAIWMDSTPESVVNLQALLPGFFSSSQATGVYEENGQIYVSGWAYPAGGGNAQAFLWIHVPAPSTAAALALAGLLAARRRRPA